MPTEEDDGDGGGALARLWRKVRGGGAAAAAALQLRGLHQQHASGGGPGGPPADDEEARLTAADRALSKCADGKVIAFICGLIVVILMIMALASTDWLMAEGWRQGLFMHCIGEKAPTPLPFNVVDTPACYQARNVVYIQASAALCVITLLTDIVATLLTGLGLRSKDHRTKYKYYKIAVYVMVLSLISILIALVIYPVFFAAELNEGNRTVWEFGWAYGVGWGAAIFLFGGVILLLCDKESEEIYYKERKIVHDSDSRA